MPLGTQQNKVTCENGYCGQVGEPIMVKVGDQEVELYWCEYHRAKYMFKMEKMQ